MATMPLRSMLLNDTWNFVNESKGAMGNMSKDDMNNMTGTSGKISFNSSILNTTFNETVGGKTLTGTWNTVNQGDTPLNLCYTSSGCISLRFTMITPNHIEMRDAHGNTIRLMR